METDDEIDMNDEVGGNWVIHMKPVVREHFDVEIYAGLYSGRTKIMRLFFVAQRCLESSVKSEALRIAYDEIKKGEDTQLFRDVVEKIDGSLGPSYMMDDAWCELIERRALQRKEKLENELNAYRTNLIKESIRMGYNDFGDFHYAHGSLGEAFKSYVRTRDYCTTSKHIIHMCLSAILVSIEMSQFSHVTSYVSRAEQTPEVLDPITISKLHCAAGLALLYDLKYKQAARRFLDVSPELGSSYNEVIAPQDIATYGGLCALAGFDRAELKSKVIDNINFRSFLELVPEIRELINTFYSSEYVSCLTYLDDVKDNLFLDIHMSRHMPRIYDEIYNKAMIQYTHPFVSVDLGIMAGVFRSTVAQLEQDLKMLITGNHIQARIDSHNKILYARPTDQRNSTFQQVLQTGSEFDWDVRSMLLRTSLIKHECQHKLAGNL